MNEDVMLKYQEINCGGSCADDCSTVDELSGQVEDLELENATVRLALSKEVSRLSGENLDLFKRCERLELALEEARNELEREQPSYSVVIRNENKRRDIQRNQSHFTGA